MPNIQHQMFGMSYGNLRPQQSGDDFWQSLRRVKEFLPNHIEGVIAPRVGFTTVVADSATPCLTPWSGWFARTSEMADGCIVHGTQAAVAIFNGDCPIIVLVEDDKLAVLHAGFRTQIRENKDEPNIIEVAMKHFNPDNTKAFVGFGIGPCCWVPEYEDKPEVLDPSKSRHPELLALCISRTTDVSPFGSDHVSVDLYKLAKGLLMEVGIPSKRVLINSQCTCCARAPDERLLYWSHNRFKAGKQEVDGRNMAVAWLDTELQSDGFETL